MSVFHDIIDKLEDIEKLLKKIEKNTTSQHMIRFTGEEMKKAKKAFKDFESDRKRV